MKSSGPRYERVVGPGMNKYAKSKESGMYQQEVVILKYLYFH